MLSHLCLGACVKCESGAEASIEGGRLCSQRVRHLSQVHRVPEASWTRCVLRWDMKEERGWHPWLGEAVPSLGEQLKRKGIVS